MYVPQCALEWLRHPNHPQLDPEAGPYLELLHRGGRHLTAHRTEEELG